MHLCSGSPVHERRDDDEQKRIPAVHNKEATAWQNHVEHLSLIIILFCSHLSAFAFHSSLNSSSVSVILQPVFHFASFHPFPASRLLLGRSTCCFVDIIMFVLSGRLSGRSSVCVCSPPSFCLMSHLTSSRISEQDQRTLLSLSHLLTDDEVSLCRITGEIRISGRVTLQLSVPSASSTLIAREPASSCW